MDVVKSFSAVILISEKTPSERLDGGFRRVGRGRALPSLIGFRRDRVVRRGREVEDASDVGISSGGIGSGFDCSSGKSSTMGESGGRGDDSLVSGLFMTISAGWGL